MRFTGIARPEEFLVTRAHVIDTARSRRSRKPLLSPRRSGTSACGLCGRRCARPAAWWLGGAVTLAGVGLPLSSELMRYHRARPQQAVEQPRDRAGRKDCEPRTNPNGDRDDPQDPSWQALHSVVPRRNNPGRICRSAVNEFSTAAPPAWRTIAADQRERCFNRTRNPQAPARLDQGRRIAACALCFDSQAGRGTWREAVPPLTEVDQSHSGGSSISDDRAGGSKCLQQSES
jgi:hypothetical protein